MMKLLIALCLGLAAAQTTWTKCATENQYCSFSGKKLVIYGYGNSLTAERVFENGVGCNNGVFGDPAYGYGKTCFIKDLPTPWTRCASENGRCAFNGKKVVRYGDLASNRWAAERIAENGIDCNNGVWGDPAYGIVKACFIRELDWTRCAAENQFCAFNGKKIVRYGDLDSGRWAAERIVDAGIGCNNGVWGDPAYGIVKACFFRDLDWTACASENGRCNFLGHKLVRYGDLASGRFAAERLAYNGVDCNNGVWGDPAYGIGKVCYISDPPQYTKCAAENQRCAFDGPMIVRYGDLAKNQWAAEKVFVGGVDCTNGVFGDPIYGTVKQCYVRPLAWTKCAAENQRCSFSGRKTVRYGDLASNRWAKEAVAQDGIDCNNGVFGDPAYGIVKACYVNDYAPAPAPVYPPANLQWVRCAAENEFCSFTQQALVRYGDKATNTWAPIKIKTNGVQCTNAVFGDPKYGTVKECFYADIAWTKCAVENQRCSFDGRMVVRYGDAATERFAAERTADGGVDCTNAVFGDPAYGTGKACYVHPILLQTKEDGQVELIAN